ncbi:MAG: hypothetical protein A2218_02305 [Elusimicrobia bacterium RIFOXYA2_FULL_53_38]|nr:MAG: hypothetical protein A2218_02305 [Elusimicrobia bacterium RIFOXYA2_FULL_53_38]
MSFARVAKPAGDSGFHSHKPGPEARRKPAGGPTARSCGSRAKANQPPLYFVYLEVKKAPLYRRGLLNLKQLGSLATAGLFLRLLGLRLILLPGLILLLVRILPLVLILLLVLGLLIVPILLLVLIPVVVCVIGIHRILLCVVNF